MTPDQAAAPPPAKKLPPLPQGARLQKRPLLRRQAAPAAARAVIYVSSSTPFMAAVRRVQRQLDRSLRDAAAAAAPRKAALHARVQALERRDLAAGGAAVTLLGTGRAVERTLAVAGWFEARGDCVVELRTGTVGTVDDVLPPEEEEEGGLADDESRVRRLSCLEVVVRLK